MKAYKLTGVNPVHVSPGRIVVPGTTEADRFEAEIDSRLEEFLIEIGAIQCLGKVEPPVEPELPKRFRKVIDKDGE